MAEIIRELTVDVAQLNRFQAIVAKQYDKQSRYLKVQLANLGENIYVDSSAMVVINARRDDGVAQSFQGTVNADGTVTVPITYWMLSLDGTVICDISIIVGSDQMLTSTLFEIEVQEAAADEEAVEQDENHGVLIDLIGEVQEIKDELQTAIDAAQLVSGPFYIVDNDNNKTYQAAIQVTNGKPICIYEEFTGGE